MNNTIFATVNGRNITGAQIVNARKRLLAEHDEDQRFVNTPNEDNLLFLNTESLQKLIETHALLAIAKFEGLEAKEEEISNQLFELRESYPDESEWEANLHDLGIDDSTIREEITTDITINLLFESRLEHLEEPSDEEISEFYQQNINFMKHPGKFSFLELEVPSPDKIQEIAAIISQNDVNKIITEAASKNISCVHNEEIPQTQLPEELQSVLNDLEENKIGSLPLEDGSIVLIKLITKIPEQEIPEEEAFSGLTEYVKFQKQQQIIDSLIEEALEKCEIIYHNPEKLKELS